MRTDHYFDSNGAGKIHYCKWMPEGQPKAVLQIIHGIAEFVERYDEFANYLTSLGYAVVAEDHMGHGQSINQDAVRGYFVGGWFAAVQDSVKLMELTMEEFPGLPYVMFGHSMGSFMLRTILVSRPGIEAAVICGTGWQPRAALPVMIRLIRSIRDKVGAKNPSATLQKLMFGGYNQKIKNPRTAYDWLTRDEKIVDAYIAHPLCGFTASSDLVLSMVGGIEYVQKKQFMRNMQKDLPVFFIAGKEDPVGPYGRGVEKAAREFQKAGMQNVSCKIYPGCRHEILNELNRQEVFEDIANWLAPYVMGAK